MYEKKISKTFNNEFIYKPSPHLLSSIIKYQNKKYKIEDFELETVWNNQIKLKDFENILSSLKKNLKDRLYLEIQRHNESQEKNFENYLLSISKSFQLPIIATQEIYYLNEDMYEAHDALVCIGEKNFIEDKDRLKYSNQHYLKAQEEIEKLYSDIPEALENNYNFHLRFNFKPKKSKPILPSIASGKNSPEDELSRLAKEGLKKRMNN